MKKHLISFAFCGLLFSSPNSLLAQTPILPLVEVGKQWTSNASYGQPGSTSPSGDCFSVYKFSRDTVVNGFTYAVLEINSLDKYTFCQLPTCPISYTHSSSKSYLRQDGNTVYYKNVPSDADKIVYQFTGLSVGDTIKFAQTQIGGCYLSSSYGQSGNFAITKIDTISILGSAVRRFKLDISSPDNYFVDGIGSSGGGIVPRTTDFFEGRLSLTCYQNSGNSFAHNNGQFSPSTNSCNSVLSIQSTETEASTFLIKQLSETEIQVVYGNSSEPYTANLYDTQGRIALKESFSKDEIIYLNGLPSGLYVLRVSLANGQVKTAKIVR